MGKATDGSTGALCSGVPVLALRSHWRLSGLGMGFIPVCALGAVRGAGGGVGASTRVWCPVVLRPAQCLSMSPVLSDEPFCQWLEVVHHGRG